jgi:hypothetical protein
MSGHGKRMVKARHEITQFYERSRLPQSNMAISDEPDPNDNSSSDEMWKMRPMYYLPGLILMAKDWQVLVAARQRGMRK